MYQQMTYFKFDDLLQATAITQTESWGKGWKIQE